MSKLLLVFVFALGFFLPALGSSHITQKPYDGFTVWLDCQRHGAAAFFYALDKDEGHIDRASKSFKIDDTVPQTCQPNSIESYVTDTVNLATGEWDRGHLVPANHMDNSLSAMTDTFFVTNVLPQNLKFNRSGGAWFQTEKISECFRDISPLSIWGGMIWGEDTGNDFFVGTHGVATADFWWKLIYRHDTKDFIAWIFPLQYFLFPIHTLSMNITASFFKAAKITPRRYGYKFRYNKFDLTPRHRRRRKAPTPRPKWTR